VSPTPQSTIQVCTHERRPGTTVCLHCRHAERLAAGERRKKLLLRGSALGIVLVIVGVTAAMSATAIRGRLIARSDAKTPVQVVSSHTTADTASPTAPIATPRTVAAPTAVAQQGETPVLMPTITAGQTILRDSVIADRTDSNVVVSFDKPMTRTRRPEKFEALLRSTLVEIYGAPVDSALARIPEGGIASQGNLITDLPTRGVRIPVSDALTLTVYPETRPGQDGPLVIRYRASVISTSAPR